MTPFDKLRLQQADEAVTVLQDIKWNFISVPSWITYMRNLLGMSSNQLAKRLGISQSAVTMMERREEKKHITLESLQKIANNLECDLVYAFVPKKSLCEFVEQQEIAKSLSILIHTHKTMCLEQQNLDIRELQKQKKIILEEIKNQPIKKLWT